jgi:predicted GNAT family acetyltransferase
MKTAPDSHVTDNTASHRFEITVDGQPAGFAEYILHTKTISLTHTVIEDGYTGRGLAGTLVRAALDSARSRNLGVLPYCPFVRDWIRRHPDYLDLVPVNRRSLFKLDQERPDAPQPHTP